jgi:hypothetical protein
MQVQPQIAQKEQSRFRVDLDQSTVRALALVLFSALWIYTALLTMPFNYWMPATGLDGSHAFGSNYFPNADFRYGSDVIFTFGPLGYLIFPENIGNHIVVANLIRGAIWLLLLTHLILFYRLGMSGFWKSLLLMAAIIPARYLLLNLFDYYAVTALLVMVLYLIEQPQARLALVSIILITGVLAMTKFTGYIMALTVVFLLLAARSDWPRKLLRAKDVYFAAAALLALPVAFLVHNLSLSGLFNYIYGSLELSTGYSEAMSTTAGAADLFYAVLLGALFGFAVIYAGAKKALPWRIAPFLLLLYWLNFKHGFVRADHAPIAFSFEIVIAAALIALIGRGSRLIRQYAVAFPFFVVLALSGANVQWVVVWSKGFWSSANTRQAASELMDWHSTKKRIDAEKAKTDEFQQLPASFKDRLEGSRVTVFPSELTYARSEHFKLEPLYTMQAYSAYTEYLDRKTADRIRAARDRTAYILFDWETIDNRHPLLDVPSTWMALTDNYEPAETSGDKLLLKRRETPLHHDQRALKDVAMPIGKWIEVPDTKTELWAKIHIPYSFSGSLRKTIYRANPIYITIRSRLFTTRFRIVPGVLSSAFPLNAFPVDLLSLVNLLESKPVQAPITAVRLDSEFPGDYGEPSLQLLEETQSELQFANAPVESFQTEFHLVSPSAITNVSAGSIDLINDIHNPATLPDEGHALKTNGTLLLEGWLADRPDGRSFDNVHAVINGRLFGATVQPRPDVGAYFKNPALNASGYRIQINAEDAGKGIHKVELIGVIKPDRLYRFPNSLYVEFR